MTSLFMGQVDVAGVPADEKVVRNTATPYSHDAPAAMATDMPEMQELENDSNPELGLAPRQKASLWIEGGNAVPQAEIVAEQNASNQKIAQQVSTSGTAASREISGQTHQNLSYAIGIEPTFDLADPNHKMGNTYFVRNERDVQATAGNYMTTAPGQDHAIVGNISAYGKDAAREAANAGMYNTWWQGIND